MITPFQSFGQSNESRIRPSDKPNGAVYSADVNGGDCTIEGFGYHNPRGLAFDKYGLKVPDQRWNGAARSAAGV